MRRALSETKRWRGRAAFRELLTTFADEGVEFVLIGGWAMALHGHGRATDDMDVLVRATPNNAMRVFRALVHSGAPVSATASRTRPPREGSMS